MFEARFVQGNLVKKVLGLLEGRRLNNDATLDCSDTGIQLQAMDESWVALVSVHLRADGFSYYRCDRPLSMGVNLGSMNKILRCAADDNTITLKAVDTPDGITFMFESPNKNKVSDYWMRLTYMQEYLIIPEETVYSAVIKMSSGEFERVVTDLSQCDEAMVIACTEEGVKFSATSGTGTMNIKLSHTANVVIEMQEPVTLNVSCRYLTMFTKAPMMSDQVSLSMAPEAPLVVEYAIGEIGHVKFYLAPRVEEEWEDTEDEESEDMEDEESEDMEMKDVIEKLEEENRKLQEDSRKLKTENEALKLNKSEWKPKIKQEKSGSKKEEDDEDCGKGRVDGKKNGVGGDEDEKEKTGAVKSKAVKRKTKHVKTRSVNNTEDENQNDRGFSQDGRPDAPEAGTPSAKVHRETSRD